MADLLERARPRPRARQLVREGQEADVPGAGRCAAASSSRVAAASRAIGGRRRRDVRRCSRSSQWAARDERIGVAMRATCVLLLSRESSGASPRITRARRSGSLAGGRRGGRAACARRDHQRRRFCRLTLAHAASRLAALGTPGFLSSASLLLPCSNRLLRLRIAPSPFVAPGWRARSQWSTR